MTRKRIMIEILANDDNDPQDFPDRKDLAVKMRDLINDHTLYNASVHEIDEIEAPE